jgi:two-component system, NarL family, nitrate/nitrite response regulator NarL
MNNATSIFLIDPHKLFRSCLVRLLKGSEFQVVTEVATVTEALSCGYPWPALILIDPLAGEQGAAAITRLRRVAPSARIVVLANKIEADSLPLLLEAGADGCLLKDTTVEALVEGLRLVMLGEKVFPSCCIMSLILKRPIGAGARIGGNRLSQREKQILCHLQDGGSNKQIGLRLDITEATVKVHLKSLLRKIGVANRTQAAIWAMNNGIEKPARVLEAV